MIKIGDSLPATTLMEYSEVEGEGCSIGPNPVPVDKATVLVERRVKHELYGKIVAKSSKYHAHDEKGEYKLGDVIEITESRPLSKTKNWVATRLVQKAGLL